MAHVTQVYEGMATGSDPDAVGKVAEAIFSRDRWGEPTPLYPQRRYPPNSGGPA